MFGGECRELCVSVRARGYVRGIVCVEEVDPAVLEGHGCNVVCIGWDGSARFIPFQFPSAPDFFWQAGHNKGHCTTVRLRRMGTSGIKMGGLGIPGVLEFGVMRT